jgi:hypothetical protein
MKVVYNNCFGGFGLSPKANRRIAELMGIECHYFKSTYNKKMEYEPVIGDDRSMFRQPFTVSNFDELFHEAKKKDPMGKYDVSNEVYKKYQFPDFRDDRTNPILVQVVEELGKEASGDCAKLEIEEIPDGANYVIEEYDGNESVKPGIRRWF